jgi:DNA-binding LacI/PurR family transcriptional regulator
MKITIRQVAKEAQVSTASVSRILNGSVNGSHDAATQQRVRAAAERLGYRANTAARLLRQQQKSLVGLVVKLTTAPPLNSLIIAVRDELIRSNFEPILFEPDQVVPSHGRNSFPSLEMLAGIFSLDFTLEMQVPNHYQRIEEIMPVIALYPVKEFDVNAIYTAHGKGIEIAAQHLFELGHTRIAFAGSPDSPYPTDLLKVEGWHQAVKTLGIESDPKLLIDLPAAVPNLPPEEIVIEAAGETVKRLERLKPRPTALICPSDEIALAILWQLGAKGWILPQDLSIVGFDGIHMGAYSHPALTTIKVPDQLVAREAVERLRQLIENKNASSQLSPTRCEIKPELLIRDSTCAPKSKR